MGGYLGGYHLGTPPGKGCSGDAPPLSLPLALPLAPPLSYPRSLRVGPRPS